MQKLQRLEIASWGAIAVSIVFAFTLVFFQWRQQLATRNARERLMRQLVQDEQAQTEREAHHRPVLATLTAVQDRREDAAFLGVMLKLMAVSGVKQVQIERVPFSQLPIMPGSPESSSSIQNGQAIPGEPALAHLPLNVTALSMRLTVEGTYAGVYRFLQRLQALRQRSRAVNTNGIAIEALHDGKVRGAITVTRFIRPATPAGS